jgi:hypothetical protein
MILPTQMATRGPNYDRYSINLYHCITIYTLRALIPVHRDPLKVEIDSRPEHVSNPSTVILPRFKEPLGILD